MANKFKGTNFDDFLEEEGILSQSASIATKRVLTFEIEKQMKKNKISKVKMAEKMKTSRSSLDRLLDPKNDSVSLRTIGKAASVLGKTVKITLT